MFNYTSGTFHAVYGRRGKYLGAGEMAQLSEGLLHKHEDLRLYPQHPCKKPGMAAHDCNPSAEQPRQADPGTHWPAVVAELACSRFFERLCLQL